VTNYCLIVVLIDTLIVVFIFYFLDV